MTAKGKLTYSLALGVTREDEEAHAARVAAGSEEEGE